MVPIRAARILATRSYLGDKIIAMKPITIPSTPAPLATPSVIREHIVCTSETCGGKPRIAGSRIQVKHVVLWHDRMGQSPAQIVSEYPYLTLADIYAALAYYHDHREEINADIQAERREYDAMKATEPSLLRDRIERRRADAPDDSIPSR
jgi:uncharacterized protein (DUF433 family)